MQSRRRWSPKALVAIVATLAATTSAFAADFSKLATELETAKPPRTAEIQEEVVKEVTAIGNPLDRNNRSKEARDAFKPLLKARSKDAQLNAAMIIARMHTIATDAALIEMLDDANAAVRYWAAKGLGEIPNLKAVGGHTAAIKALQARLAKENSGLVKKEIIHSISVLGDLADLIKVLEILSTSMQAAMPDQGTLDAAISALNDVDSLTRTAPPKAEDAAALAKAVAPLVSFATQHEFAAKSKDPAAVSDGYHAVVVNLVNTSVKVLNNAAGKSVFTGVTGDSKPEEFLLLVNAITGSGPVPGQIQKVFSGVAIPPVLKPK